MPFDRTQRRRRYRPLGMGLIIPTSASFWISGNQEARASRPCPRTFTGGTPVLPDFANVQTREDVGISKSEGVFLPAPSLGMARPFACARIHLQRDFQAAKARRFGCHRPEHPRKGRPVRKSPHRPPHGLELMAWNRTWHKWRAPQGLRRYTPDSGAFRIMRHYAATGKNALINFILSRSHGDHGESHPR